jgi:nicotinic acid mononucleotide adenylyltransferase
MSMRRRCRNVCLFGLSADPPTGTGGHVGIVQALTLLQAQTVTAGQQQQDDCDGDNDNGDGDGVDNDDGVGAAFAFDEIRVLPVYRHTYAVSMYGATEKGSIGSWINTWIRTHAFLCVFVSFVTSSWTYSTVASILVCTIRLTQNTILSYYYYYYYYYIIYDTAMHYIHTHTRIIHSFIYIYVLILICLRHERTAQDKRQRLETFAHRWSMCRAAFGGMPRVTVSDAEYRSWLAAVQDVPPEKRDRVSVGTAALVEYLNNNQNQDNNNNQDEDVKDPEVEEQYSFVLGADTFLDLIGGKWKESARVLDLLQGRLVVMERATTATASATASADDDHAADTAVADVADNDDDDDDNVALKKAVEAVPGARLLRVDNLNHISSSQVRACRSVAEMREQNMVVPAVLEYMRQHGLYAAFGDGDDDGDGDDTDG